MCDVIWHLTHVTVTLHMRRCSPRETDNTPVSLCIVVVAVSPPRRRSIGLLLVNPESIQRGCGICNALQQLLYHRIVFIAHASGPPLKVACLLFTPGLRQHACAAADGGMASWDWRPQATVRAA